MSENYNYFQKYLKYKTKYLNLKTSQSSNMTEKIELTGGAFKFKSKIHSKSNSKSNSKTHTKYKCDPNKKFLEICNQDANGIYHSKDKCMNDCENKYINKHLIDAKLKFETTQFNLFIRDLLTESITVYIKGGTVLGLKVLQMILEKESGSNFEKVFNEYLKLGLIRDWDFAGYTSNKPIDEKYREKLNSIAEKYKLVPRAKTFILYQAKYPIRLDDQALFEIAILEGDNFVDLELPLTTMKVKVTRKNLPYIFMFAKSFYSYKTKNEPIDLNVIKHMIKYMNFIIPEHKNGLFTLNKLHTGGLSSELLSLIKTFSKNNINLEQFLITHIQEPHRLLFRFFEKNIPKVNKIKTFLTENNLVRQLPSWLFDPKLMANTVESFIELLGSKIYLLYINNVDKHGAEDTIEMVSQFINGINLSRIQIEYNNFKCDGKKLIKILFSRLNKEINVEILNKMAKTNKLANILLFLNGQNIFTENTQE